MKLHTILSSVALIAGCLLASPVQAATGEQMAEAAGRGLVGSPAPRLRFKTIDGSTIDLASLYGKKAVYLKFWATWCVPCREQMPHFQKVYENSGTDLAVIAINADFNDSVDEIRRYRKAMGISMPIVLDSDGSLGAAFNLRVTPQHILIGRDGRIQHVGHLADDKLDAALKLARTQPADAKPVGAVAARALPARLRVGDTLPPVATTTLDGKSFALRAAANGRPTVMVFLSPWCESYLATTRPAVSANCRTAREQVAALAGKAEVRWLGVASGLWATSEDLVDYQKKNAVPVPLTLDESGALFRDFGVTETPTVVIADARGRIIRRVEAGQIGTLGQVLQAL